ncbi:hypothetical protein H310_10677 [Aphanomyces invadans]|uniref:SAM domain-containing protein n=1 Tax=Aphanomyces invadans TaxID=157072 RepID=A0A024TRR9_9STRA|nr:hypothetical protein H310_10677 [Aphanomyces invadans]ETV96027.1 hypothetical protein H310_10677 [Aphanomyces invadans]|eukprot:XP_008875338.1 hypothetical protein H310_10677 [Aphanomyces invadans]
MPSIVSAKFALDMDEVHRESAQAGATASPLSCSPNKIRMRIDAAKEQAKVVNSVYKEGEVIHWMSVRSPDLVEFGRSLEKRGYNTLGSIAFLTEDEFDASLSPSLKHTLLTALAQLRHDLYRM